MSKSFVLALDLGTTGVRALLVDEGARVCARPYQALSTRYPKPGWVEQDASEMWEQSRDVLRQALKDGGVEARDVAAIGVVTQRATTIAWDAESGEPLAPVIGWQDQRTRERVAELKEFGLNTMASSTKFEYWLRHDAAVQKAASKGTLRLGTPDAWLSFCLTGGHSHVTDPGNASCTALFDAGQGAWSPPLLDLFSVPLEFLPEVVATSGIIGETPPDVLGARVPVAARAGDQQAAAFAQGVHVPGDAKLTLGTSAMLDVHKGGEVPDAVPGTLRLALWTLSDGTRAFCLEGTVITAGSAIDWCVSLGLASDAADLDRLAAEAGSSDGVSFVPALQGLGTPFMDELANGCIGGMTRGTGRAQLARAAFEGVAQRCVDVYEAMDLGGAALRVDGGLARSDVLLQCISDFAGCEVQRAAETETTAMGAAFLAGLASGVFESPAACAALSAPAARFTPSWDASCRASARERWAALLERVRA